MPIHLAELCTLALQVIRSDVPFLLDRLARAEGLLRQHACTECNDGLNMCDHVRAFLEGEDCQ